MSNAKWRPSEYVHAILVTFPKLKSIAASVLQNMLNVIGYKPFLLHHAQVFPQQFIYNAFEGEQQKFMKHVKRVPIGEMPDKANIISSHTIYKIKVDECNALCLKARIAPHGNEDSLKLELKSDCAMCPLLGFRRVLTLSTINS